MVVEKKSGQPRLPKKGVRDMSSAVACRFGVERKTAERVIRGFLAEITEAVDHGDVVISGFGRFYRQEHRGHRTHFGGADTGDYPVLKFSASPVASRRLRQCEERVLP